MLEEQRALAYFGHAHAAQALVHEGEPHHLARHPHLGLDAEVREDLPGLRDRGLHGGREAVQQCEQYERDGGEPLCTYVHGVAPFRFGGPREVRGRLRARSRQTVSTLRVMGFRWTIGLFRARAEAPTSAVP